MTDRTNPNQRKHGDEPKSTSRPTFFSIPAEIRQKITDEYLTIRILDARRGLDLSDFTSNMRAALGDADYDLIMAHLRHSLQKALATHSPFNEDLEKLVGKTRDGVNSERDPSAVLGFVKKHHDMFIMYMRPRYGWLACKSRTIQFDLCQGESDVFCAPFWTTSQKLETTNWHIFQASWCYTSYLYNDVYDLRNFRHIGPNFGGDLYFRAWHRDGDTKRDIGGIYAWTLFYMMNIRVGEICRSMRQLTENSPRGGPNTIKQEAMLSMPAIAHSQMQAIDADGTAEPLKLVAASPSTCSASP